MANPENIEIGPETEFPRMFYKHINDMEFVRKLDVR